jgi:PTS system cellobiose-specific IIB component
MKIVMLCNMGMSTGILVKKLGEEAAARGIDAEVKAYPMVELADHMEGTDVILLGPQIRFALDDITKQAEGIPVLAIAPQDFGMMNAKKVMDDILKVVSK